MNITIDENEIKFIDLTKKNSDEIIELLSDFLKSKDIKILKRLSKKAYCKKYYEENKEVQKGNMSKTYHCKDCSKDIKYLNRTNHTKSLKHIENAKLMSRINELTNKNK